MKHFLVQYTTADDHLERRRDYRSEHLRLAWQFHERRGRVLAGALTEPADGAVLLFQGATAAAAEEFVYSEPYVANALICEGKVREWNTVVGELAANPLRFAD